jgi:tetratricopeptide (TPR) repeat protein
LPTLHGLIAWKQKAPKKALEGFAPILVDEYALPTLTLNGHYGALYSTYFRGLAYLDLRQPAEAVAELEKLRTHSQFVGCDPIGSLARLQLGRAYVQLGDEDKAEEAYDDFLKLWEEADVNLPVLAQAKAEYAALKHSDSHR